MLTILVATWTALIKIEVNTFNKQLQILPSLRYPVPKKYDPSWEMSAKHPECSLNTLRLGCVHNSFPPLIFKSFRHPIMKTLMFCSSRKFVRKSFHNCRTQVQVGKNGNAIRRLQFDYVALLTRLCIRVWLTGSPPIWSKEPGMNLGDLEICERKLRVASITSLIKFGVLRKLIYKIEKSSSSLVIYAMMHNQHVSIQELYENYLTQATFSLPNISVHSNV